MTARRHKTRNEVRGLSRLDPQAEAALHQQVAQVAAALEAGQETAAAQEVLQPGDLAFDLNLIAALEALAHPGVPALLAAIFGSYRDKERRKAVKRALHNLKSRGMPVPEELLPREAPTIGVPRPAAVSALLSPVFGTGDRYAILEGPREILGGNFLVARINDREGFRECHLLTLKRQRQDEFWEQFRQQGLTQWAPAPGSYVVRLLEVACRVDQSAPGAGRYAALREKILQHWGRAPEAPDPEETLPEIAPGESGRLLEQSPHLALDPLFHSWIPSPEEITPWFDRIKEAQESPLVLSESQRQARTDGVVQEATRALYPVESRPEWARRLRAMAAFLTLLGRREDARLAAAAAADLSGDRSHLTGENPFLRGLVYCALRLAYETREKPREPETSSGLLVPPTESLILRR